MPGGFLHFVGLKVATSPVCSAGESEESGNAQPAFFMRLLEPSLEPGNYEKEPCLQKEFRLGKGATLAYLPGA